MEIWKDILGYEETYEVSNFGGIRSKSRVVPCKGGTRIVKGKVRKTFLNARGYPITTLCQQNKLMTFTVHQLVAQAFIPGFTKGTEVNHIDGVPANASATNLEVSNRSHNQLHAVRTGLSPKIGVSRYRNVTYLKNPRAVSRWAASIRYAGKSTYGWKTFMTEEEAAIHVDWILDSIGDTDRIRNFPSIP